MNSTAARNYLTEGNERVARPLSERDHAFLAASIRLGRSRIGQTAPNPSVGAIIVQHGEMGDKVVGRGVTSVGGRPHGEVVALQEAGKAAKGATCYVSLEPCAHHGRTPPCVDALLNAGVSRVVIAMEDPDPRVSGKGVSFLIDAGITVYENAAVSDAQNSNLGHVKRVLEKRPSITLKLAVSKDGMIGCKGEGMVAITGELARRSVHGMRARADAVIVGVGTIISDDPDLSCRLPGMADWSPTRVILDTNARTPPTARIFQKVSTIPVQIFVNATAEKTRVKRLEEVGAKVIRLDQAVDNIPLDFVMNYLADAGYTNAMIESGPGVSSSFLEAGLVDKAFIFTGDIEIGKEGIAAHPSDRSISRVLADAGMVFITQTVYDRDELAIWERH